MPRINITEHSETYSYQTRRDGFAVVAMPICAIWGPVFDPSDSDSNPDWLLFESGYNGTTEFVRTFRGPNDSMGAREKSYDYALKLLAAGYDVLVKRVDNFGKRSYGDIWLSSPTGGRPATGTISVPTKAIVPSTITVTPAQTATFTAKRSGSYFNRVRVRIERISQPISSANMAGKVTCNLYITYVEASNSETLLEKTRFSYTQGTPTVADNEVTAWAEDSVEIQSDYIENLVIKGLGSSTSSNNDAMMTGGTDGAGGTRVKLRGKYPGTYGNQLKVRIQTDLDDLNRRIGTLEVFDRNGHWDHSLRVVNTDSLLERLNFAIDEAAATDSRPLLTELEPMYLSTVEATGIADARSGISVVASMVGGTDAVQIVDEEVDDMEGCVLASNANYEAIANIAAERFTNKNCSFIKYLTQSIGNLGPDRKFYPERARAYMQQMCLTNAMYMIPELTDPILYDWDAVFCALRDDQYVPESWLKTHEDTFTMEYEVTKLHHTLVETAANSKCGAALIGTPFGMKRGTWDEINKTATGAVLFKNELNVYLGQTYSTFAELVGPWARTTLPLGGINSWCCPEMAHLLLIISKEAKDGVRYWWLPPAGMVDTGVVYAPEYKIKKAYMDIIQNHDVGVCMNPLMNVPGKGFTCFGNSTLWDKPLGTYNALQNLSTRFLCNRVKQGIWNAALEILFKYNNNEAYTHFYALLSPLLDLMRSVGALNSTPKNPLGYRIIMNPDIVGLDHINANTVIGRVELAVQGVIDTVNVDLFLLPPNYFEEEGNL